MKNSTGVLVTLFVGFLLLQCGVAQDGYCQSNGDCGKECKVGQKISIRFLPSISITIIHNLAISTQFRCISNSSDGPLQFHPIKLFSASFHCWLLFCPDQCLFRPLQCISANSTCWTMAKCKQITLSLGKRCGKNDSKWKSTQIQNTKHNIRPGSIPQ